MHLHVVHPTSDLHPHLMSSREALAASGIVIQTGFQARSLFVQPRPSGGGAAAKGRPHAALVHNPSDVLK